MADDVRDHALNVASNALWLAGYATGGSCEKHAAVVVDALIKDGSLSAPSPKSGDPGDEIQAAKSRKTARRMMRTYARQSAENADVAACSLAPHEQNRLSSLAKIQREAAGAWAIIVIAEEMLRDADA